MAIKPHLLSKHTNITQEDYINGQLVKIFDDTTILGVRFTKDLSWNRHAEYVIQKFSCMLGVLHRDAQSMNSNVR